MSAERHKLSAWTGTLIATGLLCVLTACAGDSDKLERSSDAPSPAALTKSAAIQQIEALPAPVGVSVDTWRMLKDELKRVISADDIPILPGPPLHLRSRVDDLVASSPLPGDLHLGWSYKNNGDYDQNREVNIADLSRIGAHLRAIPADPNWERARLADGDSNFEVNIADITPIGASFRATVSRYNVQYGGTASADGPYSGIGWVEFEQGSVPNGQEWLRFSFSMPGAGNGWYRVVPYFNDEPGIPSEPANFVATVGNMPPMAALTPPLSIGNTPLTVELDASGSSDPDGDVLHYYWDLNGDGFFETDGGTQPMLEHDFTTGGLVEVGVRVADPDGLSDEAVVTVRPFHWTSYELDETSFESRPRLAEVNDLPVAVYKGGLKGPDEDGNPGGGNRIKFARAKTLITDGADDWVNITLVKGSGPYRPDPAPTEINGRPAVCFRADANAQFENPGVILDGDIVYARASVPEPLTKADFEFTVVNRAPGGKLEAFVNMLNYNGLPVVSWHSDQNDGSLHVARALTTSPSGPADWAAMQVDSDLETGNYVGENNSLAIVDNRLVVSYMHWLTDPGNNLIKVAQTTTETPSTGADWNIGTVLSGVGGASSSADTQLVVHSGDIYLANNAAVTEAFFPLSINDGTLPGGIGNWSEVLSPSPPASEIRAVSTPQGLLVLAKGASDQNAVSLFVALQPDSPQSWIELSIVDKLFGLMEIQPSALDVLALESAVYIIYRYNDLIPQDNDKYLIAWSFL